MQTRKLGPDMPPVSALGYGAMPLSLQGRPDEADAIAVVHAVLDAGVTLLDTANCYCLGPEDIGHNESLLRKALERWSGDRDRIIVATKGGSTRPDDKRWKVDGRPDSIRAACEQSLQRLGGDRIDLYQLHGPDPAVPFADTVGALAELRQRGLIRWVGLSNVGVQQIETARRIVPVQTVQNIVNPFFRDSLRGGWFRRSVLDHCAKRGLGMLAFSPVGGLLAGRIPGHPVVRELAERHGASPHAVVLAWVLAQGPHVVPIPSARTIPHALDSIRALELRLGRDDLDEITRGHFPRQ